MVGVLAVSSLPLTGCIIPEAPDYGAPRQTPIFIEEATIAPDPRSLQIVTTLDTTSVPVSFKMHSEDAGERVYAVLYSDYKHSSGHWIIDVPYEPLTYDKERTISLSVPLDALDPPACRAVTVMVLHESGYDTHNKELIGAPSDLRSVTWFMSVGTTLDDAPLDSCPTASETAGSGR
jgi:hypothetical protein